jgi:hypothetical protein
MLNADYKAVEKVIIKRIDRIREHYEFKERIGEEFWRDEVRERYRQSIAPLNASLKALRDAYFKE